MKTLTFMLVSLLHPFVGPLLMGVFANFMTNMHNTIVNEPRPSPDMGTFITMVTAFAVGLIPSLLSGGYMAYEAVSQKPFNIAVYYWLSLPIGFLAVVIILLFSFKSTIHATLISQFVLALALMGAIYVSASVSCLLFKTMLSATRFALLIPQPQPATVL